MAEPCFVIARKVVVNTVVSGKFRRGKMLLVTSVYIKLMELWCCCMLKNPETMVGNILSGFPVTESLQI
jgi:hypothetical protein